MAKGGDTVPSFYPCLMQKEGLRRVHDPQDDHPIPKPRFRQAIATLAAALQR